MAMSSCMVSTSKKRLSRRATFPCSAMTRAFCTSKNRRCSSIPKRPPSRSKNSKPTKDALPCFNSKTRKPPRNYSNARKKMFKRVVKCTKPWRTRMGKRSKEMLDLTTTYLGLLLKNPLVPSSSPLMRHLDNLKRMEDAGAAAVVLHSLFEEQIMSESQKVDFILSYGTESFPEALSYFPDVRSYNLGPDGYLEHIRRAKDAFSIPVIASLNGFSPGGWIEYARQIQEAGADALELNMYYIAADPKQDSVSVETMYLDL